MRSYVVRFATRLLLAFAMVAGEVCLVHAVTPANQDNADTLPRAMHPHGTAANEGQEDVRPAKHHGKPEPHKIVEQPRKSPAGKASEGQPQRTDVQGGKAPGAKVISARPQVGDQKLHGAAPVTIIPPAPKPPNEAPGKESGEPPPKLPRFAALKTDDTNMRKGPGQRYPIDWVYKRRDLPVEVEREYDVWRYVRDPDGVQGWVHQVTLSDRRTFMVTDKDATLRADANDTATPVALLKVGVIGRLRECDEGSKWCQVQAGGYKGYLRRDQFWGLLPDEVVAPS